MKTPSTLREYEIDPDEKSSPWLLLLLLALLLWGGAWWLGSSQIQSQGKTSTPQIK